MALALAVPASACSEGSGRSPAATTVEANDTAFGEVEQDYTGTGPKVVVLGDSIMVATAPELRDALPDHAVKVAAVRGEGLAGGPLSKVVGGSMTDVADSYASDDPEVAVIELGTNDAWLTDLALDAAVDAIEHMASAFDDACLVVVTVTERSTADGYDRAEARQINRHLLEAADEVVDWDEIGAAGGNLLDDGIHPTPAGTRALAAAVADAVASCGR